ncbi:MAG: hypothetical protein OEY38_19915 [Gammaproteobacteria bacterium]|nr:hypothetical protein [Gammaproteobacteria bacterium]
MSIAAVRETEEARKQGASYLTLPVFQFWHRVGLGNNTEFRMYIDNILWPGFGLKKQFHENFAFGGDIAVPLFTSGSPPTKPRATFYGVFGYRMKYAGLVYMANGLIPGSEQDGTNGIGLFLGFETKDKFKRTKVYELFYSNNSRSVALGMTNKF